MRWNDDYTALAAAVHHKYLIYAGARQLRIAVVDMLPIPSGVHCFVVTGDKMTVLLLAGDHDVSDVLCQSARHAAAGDRWQDHSMRWIAVRHVSEHAVGNANASLSSSLVCGRLWHDGDGGYCARGHLRHVHDAMHIRHDTTGEIIKPMRTILSYPVLSISCTIHESLTSSTRTTMNWEELIGCLLWYILYYYNFLIW